jgi:tripartite ATP-independent transporter DctM subunit
MTEFTIVGIVGLVAMLVFFMSGMGLAAGMTLVGFVGFAYRRSANAAINLLAKAYFDTFANYSFTVIPLFVLMGQVAFNSGLAETMYKTARRFLGHVPGGLGLATVVGATIFKAISGSTLATCATFASVAVPEMDKYQYQRKLSTGVVATVGTLGMLLPPSTNLIVLGMITEQSIGQLFIAGAIPGLISAALFLVVVIGWCMLDPSIAPKGPVSSWKERLQSIPAVFWPIVIFVITIGGLMAGFFTPTEAGAVGSIAILVVTMLKRDLDLNGFVKSILESVRLAAMVLMLIAGSAVLGHFVAITKIPADLAAWAQSLPVHRNFIMMVIMLLYLVGGSIMDDAAFMILATPIFYPVAMQLGFDPIWFVIMIGVTLMVGVIIPPVAVSVFIVGSITGEKISLVYKGVAPFLLALVVVMILLFTVPSLATWLPSLMGR